MFSAQHKFGRLGAPAGRSLEAAIRSLLPDVWYDPSSMETLYQDSAGTTPVTAVEQAVGLMLDKSKGLVLGPELVTNGTFASNVNDWSVTQGDGTLTWNSGSARVTGGTTNTFVSQTPTIAAGRWVLFSYKATAVSATRYSIRVAGTFVETNQASFGTRSQYVYLSAANPKIELITYAGETIDWDNISVRELPGNHAYHTPGDTTTRPVLSRRINLLTKTEQFDDAAWTKTLATVTQNTTAAPDGTLTADTLLPTAVNDYHNCAVRDISLANTAYTVTVRLKAAGYNFAALQLANSTSFGKYYEGVFNLSNGTVENTGRAVTYTGSSSITSLGNGWYECKITVNSVDANSTGLLQVVVMSTNDPLQKFAGNGTSGIYIWGASLVPADVSSLGYQRVNTATDYDSDASKFQTGESYDGVNDKMVASAGGGATTAFFFCAGIQAKGVGSTQTLWSDAGTNTGYRVRINSSNKLELSAGNGSAYTTIATTATLAVGQRAVVTAWHDGTNLNVQIGSGAVASTSFATATAGTAGFSVGGDNGAASSFFRGWIYEAVYKKDSAMTAAQIATVQRFCAAKAGITL